jgi:hypothetical protein
MSWKVRIIRMVLGIVLGGAIWYFFESWWALIGLVPFLVGATGFCPACYFLGRCSIKK